GRGRAAGTQAGLGVAVDGGAARGRGARGSHGRALAQRRAAAVSPLAHDLLVGGLQTLARIFAIIVPIVATLDLLRAYGVLARLRRPLHPVLRMLGRRPAGAEAVLAGPLLGVV